MRPTDDPGARRPMDWRLAGLLSAAAVALQVPVGVSTAYVALPMEPGARRRRRKASRSLAASPRAERSTP